MRGLNLQLTGWGAALLTMLGLAAGGSNWSVNGQNPAPSSAEEARYYVDADLMGLGFVTSGEYGVFRYRWTDAPGKPRPDYNLLYLKVKSLAALPVGKAVTVGSRAVAVSGYEISRHMRHRMGSVQGTVTRLRSDAAGHTLRLRLRCAGRAEHAELRRDVVFLVSDAVPMIPIPEPPTAPDSTAP